MENKFVISIMFFMSALMMGCGFYFWHWRSKVLFQQEVELDLKDDAIADSRKSGLRLLLIALCWAILTIAAGNLGFMAFIFWIVSALYMGIALVEYWQMKRPAQALMMLIVPVSLSVQEYQSRFWLILIALMVIIYDLYRSRQLNPFARK